MIENSHKIILDLCGGTGAWSKPYREAGYDVRLITLPDNDVRTYEPPENVYGILAAPPCTEFAVSGATCWKNKEKHLLQDALDIVESVMLIILQCNPLFWVLENPVGRLRKYIGRPIYTFNPHEYGDPYTKKTCLWGNFKIPTPIINYVEPKFVVMKDGKRMSQNHYDSFIKMNGEKRREFRSITPPGFAKAFFEANQ